ncbi:hypothetical protein [Azospirillum melinis]
MFLSIPPRWLRPGALSLGCVGPGPDWSGVTSRPGGTPLPGRFFDRISGRLSIRFFGRIYPFRHRIS